MRIPLCALAALSVLAAPAAWAQTFDGDWFGTVDCVARDVFDRGSTQARGSVVNDVLTLRFASATLGQASVSGRIVEAGPARLLRLEGSLPRGGFATFDGVVVTPRQIHARGVVGETACNVNLTPARAPAEAAAPRAEQPPFGRAVPPAPPAYVPPRPNTWPAPNTVAPNAAPPGKFAAPAPAPPPERPRAGASIQAPQPIDRPAPGAAVTGLAPPPQPPPTAQAPAPRVVPAAPPPTPAPPAATNPQVADRLACALAGTCGPAGAAPARP